MTHFITIATSIPHTAEWTPMVGAVMIICNVFAIAIGKLAMGTPHNKTGITQSRNVWWHGMACIASHN